MCVCVCVCVCDAGFRWMHPEDLVGDRFAVLFIGFLILITNVQTDLGLGAHTQLLL